MLQSAKALAEKYPKFLNLSWEGENGEFTLSLEDARAEYGELSYTPGDNLTLNLSLSQQVPRAMGPVLDEVFRLFRKNLSK